MVSAVVRTVLRWLLGGALIGAGVGHLTAQRTEFRAQVPGWFPLDADLVRAGFASTVSPGRLEVVRRSPTIIVDTN